jgi:hypothetical protein
LGGAISMIIVGFAVAWLGRPSFEEEMYALQIHGIPQRHKVGDVEYRVFVGAADDSNLSITRDRSSVTITVPPRPATYKAHIAVFKTDRDRSRTFARCDLTFETHHAHHQSLAPMQLVAERAPPHFHLFLADTYIEKVVKASLQANATVESEPCIEGRVATKKTAKTPLRGRFTLLPISIGDRMSSMVKLTALPRYSVLASDMSNVDPQDTQPDLPPRSTPVPGGTVGLAPSESSAPPPAPAPTVTPRPAPPAPSPSAELPAPAPTATAQPAAPTSTASSQLHAQVDAYIRGEDLDRMQLYQSWKNVADYVVQGFRNEAGKESKFAARYVNLIANALNVIDDGKYLPPTRRPGWDDSVKPDRLARSRNIPSFQADDYRKVVALLCSRDEEVRLAAQRLLKLYPSNNFYQHIQALLKQGEFDKCKLAFVAETAVNFFYNRLVEYDGTFALDKDSRGWIDGNYKDGVEWVKRAAAEDPSHGIFRAMLDYARGLVLWDHGEQAAALPYFNQMLDAVRSSSGIYPSNPQHIAVAVKLVNVPRAAKLPDSAKPYAPGERRPIARTYMVSGGMVSLRAVPEPSAKQVGKVGPDSTARMYLRAEGWDLIQVGDQIGWAQRMIASARN